MTTAWRPDGYSTIAPYLIVDGADRTLRWLTEVLGAQEIRRFTDDEGRILHAETRLGDSVIMIGDCVPGVWPPTVSGVHVYVPDVDAAYAQALRAGGDSIQPPNQRPGETDRRCGVKDPGGTTWWLASQVSSPGAP